MPSTLQRIMEEVRNKLQEMQFTPEPGDGCAGISRDSIVIWKTGIGMKDGEESLPQVNLPGLVITPPKSVRAPSMMGTNKRDDVIYPVLIQLVDNDGTERYNNLPSYLRWLEQIRRTMHARSWPEVELKAYGDVYASFAETTDTVDLKTWKRFPGLFVAGVAVLFTVRETRE